MRSKDKMVKHVDNVIGVILVLLPQVFQDSNLFLSLSVKSFLISYHFQGNMKMTLVIIGFDHLTEAALPDDFEHFITIGQMVVSYVSVGALVVVIPAIIGASDDAWPFLGVGPNEVDLRIVEDLVVFIGCQLVHI